VGIIAIVAALLLEQWRPLGNRKAVAAALAGWADWLENLFNAGEARQWNGDAVQIRAEQQSRHDRRNRETRRARSDFRDSRADNDPSHRVQFNPIREPSPGTQRHCVIGSFPRA